MSFPTKQSFLERAGWATSLIFNRVGEAKASTYPPSTSPASKNTDAWPKNTDDWKCFKCGSSGYRCGCFVPSEGVKDHEGRSP
jgi:hypothetical protein